MDAKLKQTEKVNQQRNQKALKLKRKGPLYIGDICTISTEERRYTSFTYQ
jgi:hypothetical protein